MVLHPSCINNHLKIKYLLHFFVSYIYTFFYTAVQISKCLKNTSVIKVATMKNADGVASINYHLKVKYLLCFFFSHVTRQYKSRTVRKAPLIKVATIKNTDGTKLSCYIKYHLKVKHPLCFLVSYV